MLEANASSPEVTALRAKGEEAASKSGNSTFNQFLNEGANRQLAHYQARIAEEIAAKREEGASSDLPRLRAQIERIHKVFPSMTTRRASWGSSYERQYSEEFAWEGRAHESAYRLLEAQKTGSTDTAQLQGLENELDRSAKLSGKSPDAVVNWEKTRLAKNEPLVTADNYRLRAGDPLISVLAPATCLSVVARMPDGSLLPLRFNTGNGSWEARFDVPTFAPDGGYQVQIFIVLPGGARRHLTMNFAVDSGAPTGKGTVQSDGKTWHLKMESDEHTDRVSAFLPWQERVELKRDEGAAFVADMSVPAEFQHTKSQIRFLLTDAAHNRTEVLLDWN